MNSNRKIIALIPARGGSKGLPGKNILQIAGHPLIAHTIMEARKSRYISEVFVSTDYDEIAEISKKYGASVPFMRPAELASDEAKSIDVITYTIDRLRSEGIDIDDFILLQPTSPLRTAAHIDQAIKLFYDCDADSVISMTTAKPYVWHHGIDESGRVHKIFDSAESRNRQEFIKTYIPNGSMYISKYDELKSTNQFYTDRTYAYIMSLSSSIDIDDAEDFRLARLLMEDQQNG